jgi:hypothetical protein
MTVQRRSLRHILVVLVISVSLFILPQIGIPEQGALRLDFKEGTVSADIDSKPLRAVLDVITKQRGIRFETRKGADFLLNEQISVQFEKLPVQDAIARILAGINHCLVFRGDSIFRVMLFGKVENKRSTGRGAARRSRRLPRPR